MSKFKVGDLVEAEFFPDAMPVQEVQGNAIKVNETWYLEKNVELVERVSEKLKTEKRGLQNYLPAEGTPHIYEYSNLLRQGYSEEDARKIVQDKLDYTEKLKTEQHGIKHDQEKPDLSLLPKEFLEEVAKAFMHGEKKYGRYNYRNGMDWHRLIAACFRHITAFNEGEDNDKESSFSHLGHAGACIAMLLVYKKNSLGKDTRYKK